MIHESTLPQTPNPTPCPHEKLFAANPKQKIFINFLTKPGR
ncbi:hypothetical protein N0824_00019 [Microcystis sp. 0824]|nr:hypothetical protein N0824_00019 [Microcystis sp. 0824]